MAFRDSVILTPDRLQTVVERFMQRPAFVFDIETMGPHRGVPTQNKANWMSLATDGMAYAIPFGHPNGDTLISKGTKKKNKITGKFDPIAAVYDAPPEQMLPSEVFEIIRPLFFTEGKVKIAHNATFDLISTAKYWGEIAAPEYSDTIVLQWLLDENMKQKGLKELTRKYYKVDYDQENVGKEVEAHPFSKVAHYAYMDAKYTWLLWKKFQQKIEQEGLTNVRRLEEDVLGVLLDMGVEGAPVDEDAMKNLVYDMTVLMEDTEGRIYKTAGKKFNLNAPAQKAAVLYGPKSEGGQGLKPFKLTDGGKKAREAGETLEYKHYSTDSDSLEKHANNAVVKELLEYAEVSKLLDYPLSYLGDPDDPKKPCRIFDGRIHADLVQYGTVTGRFSCVSGGTVIQTSRGSFEIGEYLPQEGDLVLTHAGNYKPVLRKLYKGVQPMYRVVLDNGSEIAATADHRFFGPDGWVHVRDLEVGRTLFSDSFAGVRIGSGEHPESDNGLLLRGQADHSGSGQELGDLVAERGSNTVSQSAEGEIFRREGFALLPLEDGSVQPDVWTEWRAAPQLDRGSWGRARVPAIDGEWEVRIHSSADLGSGAGDSGTSGVLGRAPHRREQAQQPVGQPGAGNPGSPRPDARQEIAVREITPVGSMGAWDLEVAGDHSYVAQGFLNHNCREPNLQNIPRPDTELGKRIRGLFKAPKGYKFVVADWGQIELVVLAHFIGRGALYDGFHKGIDPHSATAAALLGEDPFEFQAKVKAGDPEAKRMRQIAKGINFAVVYGAGAEKVASMAKITLKEAKRFLEIHQRAFPEIYRFKDEVVRRCRSRRPAYIRTILGRKRRLPMIMSQNNGLRMGAERQAVNSLIQGSATGDLIKLALIRLNGLLHGSMRLVLTVHDEIVVLAKEEDSAECAELVKEAMLGEGIQKLLRVPLSSDVKIVDRWSEAK